MTVYRVGPAGATVFNEDGQVVARLRPGHVVVPGAVEEPATQAAKYALQQRRVTGYGDKRLHPHESTAD